MDTFQKPMDIFKTTLQSVIFSIVSRLKLCVKKHYSTQVAPKTETITQARTVVLIFLFFKLNTHKNIQNVLLLCIVHSKIKRNFQKTVPQRKSYNELSRDNAFSTLKFLTRICGGLSTILFDSRSVNFGEKQKGGPIKKKNP